MLRLGMITNEVALTSVGLGIFVAKTYIIIIIDDNDTIATLNLKKSGSVCGVVVAVVAASVVRRAAVVVVVVIRGVVVFKETVVKRGKCGNFLRELEEKVNTPLSRTRSPL